MKDGVIAGTGNSRFLKSGITEETTWEQFRAALVAGNLPIDMNGANPDGWTQMGSAISKSNLLPDALATLLGLSLGDDPQIKDALGALYAAASAAAKAEIGTYTGTGTYGALNKKLYHVWRVTKGDIYIINNGFKIFRVWRYISITISRINHDDRKRRANNNSVRCRPNSLCSRIFNGNHGILEYNVNKTALSA